MKINGGKCSLDWCDLIAEKRGLCSKHFTRLRRYGDTETRKILKGEPLSVRFWAKVNKNGPIPEYAPHLGPCWLWTASTHAGYGCIGDENNKVVSAHRVAYELLVGSIPEGLHLDHLCRVPLCVNPSHLEPVTPRENLMRGVSFSADNAKKTHCVNGHEFTPENTRPRLQGGRACRACDKIRNKISYYKKKGG